MSAMLLALAGCAAGDLEDLGLPCVTGADHRQCPHATVKLRTGWGGLESREVHFQVPEGAPPAAGWPAAILYQGSLYGARTFWESTPDGPHGQWHQVGLVEALLEAGVAVVTPETRLGGRTWWDTNVPPFDRLWTTSADHQLVLDLLDAIEAGELGELDPDTLYAAGISSGGYMTSRMAVSYPGRFSALAIQSASYATCSGPLCSVPELPVDHPPTLLLVGEQDRVVPPWTTDAYAESLASQGTEVDVRRAADVGHAWLPEAPEAVTDWFLDR